MFICKVFALLGVKEEASSSTWNWKPIMKCVRFVVRGCIIIHLTILHGKENTALIHLKCNGTIKIIHIRYWYEVYFYIAQYISSVYSQKWFHNMLWWMLGSKQYHNSLHDLFKCHFLLFAYYRSNGTYFKNTYVLAYVKDPNNHLNVNKIKW